MYFSLNVAQGCRHGFVETQWCEPMRFYVVTSLTSHCRFFLRFKWIAQRGEAKRSKHQPQVISPLKRIKSFVLKQSCFSDFVFKIRLIRLGVYFPKTKIPVFELPTYWFSVRSLNHYITEPTVNGTHRKAFSNLQSCLTYSSWIRLILLIQLI